MSDAARDDLVEQIKALGPWHHEVAVVPGLTTGVSRDVEYPDEYGEVVLTDYRGEFHALIGSLYPSLESKSFLDCACNCGGYLFWAKSSARSEPSASMSASTGSARHGFARSTGRRSRSSRGCWSGRLDARHQRTSCSSMTP